MNEVALDLSAAPTLEAFYRGERAIMEQCYRQHLPEVELAVSRTLGGNGAGVDRETVVYEVFSRLLGDEAFRRSFDGRRLGAWLAQVASNLAIDHHRRAAREVTLPPDEATALSEQRGGTGFEEQLVARDWLRRFRGRVPSKWLPVFEACFVERLDQRTAAARLHMPRTTLAYQVLRLKWLLERFVLEEPDP